MKITKNGISVVKPTSKNIKVLTLCLFVVVCFLSSCGNNGQEELSDDINNNDSVLAFDRYADEPIETMVLNEKTFYKELVSNGKAVAQHSAELHFGTSGRIAHIWVKNGEYVHKGQRIAQIDSFRLEHLLAQAKNNMLQSKLDFLDILIGRGYSIDTLSDIPAEEIELAQIKSGYNKFVIAYEMAEKDLHEATLIAPFDGVIANITSKENNMISPDNTFCYIMDDKYQEILFSVLESEMSFVKKGNAVMIQPFAEAPPKEPLWGTVTEINPYIESNGMIKVKAIVKNNGQILEGMNVNVLLRHPQEHCLVIPKSAVVIRAGKNVVFTKVDGKAQWNYVEILTENSDSCAIVPRSKKYEGLSIGDTVIVSGNLNMNHDMEL